MTDLHFPDVIRNPVGRYEVVSSPWAAGGRRLDVRNRRIGRVGKNGQTDVAA